MPGRIAPSGPTAPVARPRSPSAASWPTWPRGSDQLPDPGPSRQPPRTHRPLVPAGVRRL